jgi:hypothetical protein
MTVQSDGSMTVSVDGLRLLPGTGVWGRESYAEVVDHATVDRSIAAVVQVREADGTVFRELVPAVRTLPVSPRSLEMSGVGFLPGEQVAVAPIGLHLAAADDGTVPHPIELWAAGVEPVEVVLLGRTSGTIHVAGLL